MGLEKQTKAIGEFSYEVTPLGAKDGNRVLMKIAKTVGPMFLLAAGGGGGVDGIAKSVEAIKDMSEADFEWVIDKLASHTGVVYPDGRVPRLAQIFDGHFAGLYAEEIEWLEFAIDVNFAPFFRGLKAKIAARAGTTPTPSNSTSPGTSTGASSAS